MSDSNILHRLRELGEHHELAYEAASEIESLRFRVRELTTATYPLATAVPQQEAGEPVGEVVGTEKRGFALMTLVRWEPGFDRTKLGTKLYATPQVSPQARVPLTEGQILTGWGHGDLLANTSGPPHRGLKRELETFTSGVRFAERARLIGPETKE